MKLDPAHPELQPGKASKSSLQRRFLALAVLGCSTGIFADASSLAPEYYVEVGGGYEYDSTVTVDELDLNSNESDTGLLFDIGAGITQPLPNDTEAKLWYEYSLIDYDEFDEVSRQTHLVGADFSVDTGQFDLGLSAMHIDSRLDGEDFLVLNRASPYISGFVSKRWFTRAAYTYSDKTIDNSPGRDATSQSAEVDLYYFRDGPSSYLNLAYRFRDEDADAPRYDYQSHRFKLRYVKKLTVLEKETRLELSWRYEDRDYDRLSPGIGDKRDDKRQRWGLEYRIPLLEHGGLEFYYMYSDYDSNLPTVDYYQDVLGTRVFYRWQ